MSKKETTGKMAVVYARYSSHNQGEQSIEGQLAAAKTYADAKGYTIVHEYIDRAISGRTDNRYEFQKMLSDCAKGHFQIIIVWKVDRFGRNREEITFNKYRAKKHGVAVEYVAENLPDSPEGVILESVLEGMAEYYSLQLSQNVRRGLHETAKKCKWTGGKVPLGYQITTDGDFEINPDTAPIVKKIFDLYVAGKTMSEIIRELENDGIYNSKGKPYTLGHVRAVLQNKKYIGVYQFKDEIYVEDAIPALIDKETFEKAQEMLKINRRMPSHKWTYADYLLTGKVFCGHCGAAMIGTSATPPKGSEARYHYYCCVNNRKHGKICKKKAVRKERLEKAVLNEVMKLLDDDELIAFITDKTWEYYQDQDKNTEHLQMLRKQLTDTQNGINNLVRSIEAGIFNDTIKARMEELTAQQEALKKAIADFEIQSSLSLTREHIQFFIEQFRDADLSDRECQKRLIDIFINSIYLYDNGDLKINFNFGGDTSTVTLNDIKAAERSGGNFRLLRASLWDSDNGRKYSWILNVISVDTKL